MKNLKVSAKMTILLLCVILLSFFSILLSSNNMKKLEEESLAVLEETIREDYDQSIKEQVDNVISLLNTIYAQYEKGTDRKSVV